MSIRSQIRPAAVDIIRRLNQNRYEAYIVGGAVRDLLLGRTPKDFDIATAATPEQVRAVFGRGRCHIIGRRFKLAHVFYGRDTYYEVSTFRRQPNADERCTRDDDDGVLIWNDNEYGTIEEDAQRRDFTVNALYLDVIGDRGIIDFTGGLKDIEQRMVRTIGQAETRFTEDPVRMLRALKLVGMHQMTLAPETEAAISRLCGRIRQASVARLFDELLKIFQTDCAGAILQTCRQHGLLSTLWPGLASIWDKPPGRIALGMLQARDRATKKGDYSTSRALALATPCLPYVMNILRTHDNGVFPLWDSTMNKQCGHAIRSFYDGFVLPHVLTARIRAMILMVPPLAEGVQIDYLAQQPDYKYGRELLRLLVESCRWDPALMQNLPEPGQPATSGAGRLPRKRRRRPRRPRQPEAEPAAEATMPDASP
ncbi:MAG TPA: polynucleotide adenylyltransferase PcnB [Lentisphaeria bacterium]|nr:polynucleotide adenylyltransferase PcnB [Lentisphaerota bacterium]HQC53082.1 polynucleotide adenylyltransferase PcnB [Lentisphaeria bacterium]HQL88672.1 polynucleotide adenylyltransferase PcnB [Lentisphaeria bacterium]